MKVKKPMSDQSTLWGNTLDFWDKRGVILMVAGGVLGFVALAATVASSFILWRVAGLAQSDLENVTRTHETEIGQQKKETEELRAKNLELEKAVSPRILEQGLTSHKLKRFADVEVLVVSPSDFEPKRTAGQIRAMLNMAGWKRFSGTLNQRYPFFDGVVIHRAVGPGSARASEAANALFEVLKEAGIEARTGYPIQALGLSALLVEVDQIRYRQRCD
jgi:hypothetical protein